MRIVLLLLLGAIAVFANKHSDTCNETCSCIAGNKVSKPSKLGVKEAFKKYDIVKDYLPVPPKDFLEAFFITQNIELGTFISPLRNIDPGVAIYPKAEVDHLYTLLFVDIDAPSEQKDNKGHVFEFLANVPGQNLLRGQGKDHPFNSVVVPFSPPVPALNSGCHRLVGLLYEQQNVIDINEEQLVQLARSRLIPDIEEFTKNYDLGDPIAGTFYVSELNYCNATSQCETQYHSKL